MKELVALSFGVVLFLTVLYTVTVPYLHESQSEVSNVESFIFDEGREMYNLSTTHNITSWRVVKEDGTDITKDCELDNNTLRFTSTSNIAEGDTFYVRYTYLIQNELGDMESKLKDLMALVLLAGGVLLLGMLLWRYGL